MLVEQLMRKDVKHCSPLDSLDRAARLMWEHDVGAVPVVDTEGRVTAMVTDRDICMAGYTQGRAPHQLSVASAASRRLVTVRASDSIETAERLMREHQLRRLPVTDDGARLVGILSLSDLARSANGGALDVARTLEAISLSASAPARRTNGHARRRRTLALTPPKLAFVISTRAALGAGIGLLASGRLSRGVSRAFGLGLVALGALTTLPTLWTIASSARPRGGDLA